MTNLRNLFGLFLVSLLFFTACKKDAVNPINAPKNTPLTTTDNNTISSATQARAMAAALMATSRNGENPDTTFNDCGCYDLFNDVNFDASHEEVDAQIDAILEGLSEEEVNRLFEPVCTEDGQIYESACIADCEGATNYSVCSEEQLDDYFFGDFECDDLENLTFPTEIELPDGTKVTVNSEEELYDLLDKWYEENDDDYDDWGGEEWDDEYGEGYYDDCFTVLFPVQVQYPDGNVVSYDTEDALYDAIDAWYESNPEAMEEPMPVYPITVQLPDSSTVVVNNETEEDALWESCGYSEEDYECFNLNYPITLIDAAGNPVIVNNDDELEKAIDAYYEANPETEEDIQVKYPIDITLKDGTVQTINSDDELDAAFENCYSDDDDYGRFAKRNEGLTHSKKTVPKTIISKKRN